MIHRTEVSETSKTFATAGGGNINEDAPIRGRWLVSRQEMAHVAGVSLRTIDNWIALRRIPFIRLSARLIRFNPDRVMAALARYEIQEVGARK
jgi:excisionase family DNA binding protein